MQGHLRRTLRGVALCWLIASTGVLGSDDLNTWVNNFYHTRPLCGNSTVENTRLTDENLQVNLIIDKVWAKSMESYDKQASDHWFAIHCPLPFESASPLLKGRDIIIRTSSISGSLYTMSCRKFSEQQNTDAANRRVAARSRVQKILDKLGLSDP